MRAITGVQPTNILHIGNLFGAVLPSIALQKDYDLFMMVVDLHAITVPQDPKTLRANILFATAAYIAAGADPTKTVIFQQSQVPAHTELAWLLQTRARMGEMERMTQFKDKSRDKGEDVSVGLYTYPVLMAADILLYDNDVVPVGEDQKQHLELTRDLAQRFNRDFGETFTVPKPIIAQLGGRVLGLDNPEKKMSKSAPTPKNYISIMDDADTIRKKIKAAVTDSERLITVDDARPGLKNLLTIMHMVTKESLVDIAAKYDGKGMKDLKDDVAEALCLYLGPLQAEMKGLLANEDLLVKVLNDGSARAAEVAEKKVQQVKKRMGLLL